MKRSDCQCPIPHPGYVTEYRPRGNEYCSCGGYIHPRWTSNDETMGEVYDRLVAVNQQPDPTDPEGRRTVVPEIFQQFLLEALAREHAGRKTFGLRFLGRDNIKDGWQEATDGANYAAFEIIKRANRQGDDSGITVLLRAMQKFYEAYELLAEARKS